MNTQQTFGRAAEQAAADFLHAAGWRILGRNVRVGRGELDLIMRRGAVLAFVEVKARCSMSCGLPEDAVGARKRRQIARLAELWLATHRGALRGVTDIRFDIVAIDARTAPATIRHVPAAFTTTS
jgi:putative endonuclease